ncbi:MAG TPA: hypothetical protein VFX94_06515 [Burkholderiales bacterium]|nr:hypothetical protein [Burkholderiales bacterium]
MTQLERTLAKRRALEVIGMALAGDGVLSIVDPVGHTALWAQGPRFWRALVEPFARRPRLTGAVGLGLVVAGVWIAGGAYRR